MEDKILILLKKSYNINSLVYYSTIVPLLLISMLYYENISIYSLGINLMLIVAMTFIYRVSIKYLNIIYGLKEKNKNDNSFIYGATMILTIITSSFIPLAIISLLNILDIINS